jgi:benzaldehyde dehydrogenase (NAD)
VGRAHLDRARDAKLQWQTFTTEEKVIAVETSERATLEVLEKATGEPIGTEVARDMPLWSEEIFAPIAPVMPVDSEEHAIALVNDTRYGLVNAVVSGDPDRGLRVAGKLRSGMVDVNDSTCLDEAHVPFGGLGASGLGGRSGGEANLEEFTERRWVSLQRAPVEYPY